MANLEISTKRLAISKANAQMVVIIGIASFITIFCLVASKSVFSQTRYQARVLSTSNKAKGQLVSNINSYVNLKQTFNNFQTGTTNIIGGQTDGNGNNSGPNAQIILDSLPPKYDFPALLSSIQKLFSTANITLTSISGTDEQVTEGPNTTSPNPTPVAMPFTLDVENTNYNTIQQILTLMQESVRPLQVDTMSITGSGNNMTLSLSAHSYFQPGQTVNISQITVN